MDNTEKNLEAINSEINEAIDEVKSKNENVEIEVTEEAPAPQEDKVAKQKAEDEEYGAKVKKRIKKLIAEKHEAESEALNLKKQLDTLSQRMQKIEDVNTKQGQNAVQEHYDLTKQALAKAIEEGDTDAQVKFNEELVDIKTALALQKIENQKKRETASPTVGKANYIQQNPTPALATEWWKKNDWFNAKGFEQETAMARAIDVQLDIEGFDKNAPEYYQELNSRLQKRFPELISEDEVTKSKPRTNSRQAVAPTTGGSGYRGNRLKVTKDELAMARELGITDPTALQKYAKEIQTIKNRGNN
tara:strand:+ start:1676 stop:2584 length:909 start_codon:yes stop_codon:yes gene_type:complete